MAGSIDQLWSLGLLKSENPIQNLQYATPCKVAKPSLQSDSCFSPSWVHEELKGRVLCVSTPPQDVELCTKVTRRHKALTRNDQRTSFVSLLRSCAKNKDLLRGSRLHDDILKQGLLEKCSDALVTMYARCGALAKAKELLDTHNSRNAFCWTTLIAECARQGQGHDALHYYEQMQHEGLTPDAVTFSCILKACGTIKAVDKGKQIHDEIAKQGLLKNDVVLGTALVDMYAKCGFVAKAREVLEMLPSRNVVSWNALITGYAQEGQGEQALSCFEQMRREGFSPNEVTFTCMLKACGSMRAINKGKKIHDEIARQGLLDNSIVLGTALVNMYTKCGALAKAQQVLEELPSRNAVSWNTLIAGYAQEGQGEQALKCFERMQQEDLSPDWVTFACILKACGTIRAAEKGEQIHDEINRQGLLENNIVLGVALVDMYAKCGALEKARQVLEELPSRNVVSWNALITGYAEHGQVEQVLNCLKQMQHEGLSPDSVTYTCMLKACGSLGALDKGEQIHEEIAKQGLLGNNIVLGTALVDMYAKCSALGEAHRVLEELPSRDVVSWSVLIAGYVEHGQGEQALKCFEQMQHEGLFPDAVTFTCILKACGTIRATNKGEQIHDQITRQGLLGNNIVLGNALVDMYVKCGALAKASQVIEELPSRDVVSWSTLMLGYAKEGQAEKALKCFKQMQRESISPDTLTFSCVLNACSHLGLVDEGYMYFASMNTKYGINPDIVHYTCMIDLFGRAGHFDKAIRVIQEMPSYHDSVLWLALLGACQKWGDVNVGKWAFEQAIQVDRSDSAAYVLMGNIYTAAGLQKDAEMIEAMRTENKAWKKPGHSKWVGTFRASNIRHWGCEVW